MEYICVLLKMTIPTTKSLISNKLSRLEMKSINDSNSNNDTRNKMTSKKSIQKHRQK
jgi:hypothetical protein